MSLNIQGGVFAAAYYTTENGQICGVPDRTESSDFSFLKLLKRQVKPTVIVTSSKLDPKAVEVVSLKDGLC